MFFCFLFYYIFQYYFLDCFFFFLVDLVFGPKGAFVWEYVCFAGYFLRVFRDGFVGSFPFSKGFSVFFVCFFIGVFLSCCPGFLSKS